MDVAQPAGESERWHYATGAGPAQRKPPESEVGTGRMRKGRTDLGPNPMASSQWKGAFTATLGVAEGFARQVLTRRARQSGLAWLCVATARPCFP
jgi:hypothetical protein